MPYHIKMAPPVDDKEGTGHASDYSTTEEISEIDRRLHALQSFLKGAQGQGGGAPHTGTFVEVVELEGC